MGAFQDLIAAYRNFINRNRHRIRPGGAIADPKHARAQILRDVANTFLDGFMVAMEAPGQSVQKEISTLPKTERGVCYEGAAAGKTVRDLTANNDLYEASALLREEESYSFLLYLGIGEAMAQLKLPPQLCNAVAKERWSGQIIEGYGFFDGYFNWYDALVHQKYPQGLEPGLKAAYDQGIGRAIYFVTNCDPVQMRDMIACYAPERRSEIWSGAGIPVAYVGGLSERELKKFLNFAGPYRAELMQGVLLGASARARQNVIPDHTELACNVMCGDSTLDAVNYTDRLSQLLTDREQYSMFEWQTLVRRALRKDGR
jgi:enediyne biosynthesis protein E3